MGSRPGNTGRVDGLKLRAEGDGPRPQRSSAKKQTKPVKVKVDAAATGDAEVRLVAVAKSFGKHAVLKGLNLTVGPGELVEVTGPSGSGKTTLLRLVHGQLRPNAGELYVRGRALHRWWRWGLDRLRRDVAYVFQEQCLLPRLTAFENIVLALQIHDPQLPNRSIRDRALAALEAVKLDRRGDSYPHQLSAGERQRVAIARALATRPRVLLADEPLAGLDDANAAIVIELLEKAAEAGTTVIVATHHHTFPANRILRLPSERIGTNGARRHVNRNGHSSGHVNTHSNGHANGALNDNGSTNGNGHKPAAAALPALLRRVVPARERAHPIRRQPTLPLWRRSLAVVGNGHRLVVLGGLRSWRRDARTMAPVIGTIALLLVLCGTLALVGVSVARAAADQAGQASLVRVYLAPDATPDSIAALTSKLRADPRIASVTRVSAEQALAEASRRPGLDSLASLSSTNPFPASLDVRVKVVTQVAAVAGSVSGDPAVDQSYPTSYDPDTYSRLRHIALIAGAIAAGVLVLFAVVAYAVIANSMRSVAAARRNEVAVTRLLGARGWMMRGPFVVEGLMTGAIAGAVAAALVAGAYLIGIRFESAIYSQLLPGVDANAVRYVLAAVITAGLLLSAATAAFGFRKARD